MDARVARNRALWDVAAQKYVRESEALLDEARRSSSLAQAERALLAPLLEAAPLVVHLQSGHGLDDLDLARGGACGVIGVDLSLVTAGAARLRATKFDAGVHYVNADVLRLPLREACSDLVYTGKGALCWLPDIEAWGREAARPLRPGGHLFVYDAHPAACLWTWDPDHAQIRADLSYFGGTRVNDSFPGSAGTEAGLDAVEWQWSVADVVNAVVAAGLELLHLGEYPEPFWRPGGYEAAAWRGALPNCFSVLARRRSQ